MSVFGVEDVRVWVIGGEGLGGVRSAHWSTRGLLGGYGD